MSEQYNNNVAILATVIEVSRRVLQDTSINFSMENAEPLGEDSEVNLSTSYIATVVERKLKEKIGKIGVVYDQQ